MIDIFLSASVPLPERNRHFFETADVIAIREAVKALVEIVLPVGRITFGGHPAITPLISLFIKEAGLNHDRLTIFQSRYFEDLLPQENELFHDVRLVDAVANDRESSLLAMRRAMIVSRSFTSAVFIGGMEGVIDEANLVSLLRPNTKLLPVASTGAAAADMYRKSDYPRDYNDDLTYVTLFRRHLLDGSEFRG
jgi:hypothetical protein